LNVSIKLDEKGKRIKLQLRNKEILQTMINIRYLWLHMCVFSCISVVDCAASSPGEERLMERWICIFFGVGIPPMTHKSSIFHKFPNFEQFKTTAREIYGPKCAAVAVIKHVKLTYI
jgi:predicted membrane channel-forming protein YqfA (hemolysin III family)